MMHRCFLVMVLALVSALAVMYVFSESTAAVVVLVALGLALLWRLAGQLKERREISRFTLESYVEQNPSCNICGTVSCNECGSARVAPQTERKHSDYWQHCCKDCGKTLFFTKK